ncbi:MAG TPA: magnesium/cobalt efflux protein, partial [Hyphomonas sp.]|nr:magnesium/cobalt efflux protein [Hyphomonas sp.]
MSDPDPSDAPPSGRLRSFFGFRRKPAPVEPVSAATNGETPPHNPHEMRLRLAEFQDL